MYLCEKLNCLQNSGHQLPQNSQRIQGSRAAVSSVASSQRVQYWPHLTLPSSPPGETWWQQHSSPCMGRRCLIPPYPDQTIAMLKACQEECFPEEVKALKSSKPVLPSSRLHTLSPDLDGTTGLIRVGGCLRRRDSPSLTDIHPIILDPHHAVTKLFSISIKDLDERLLHPGTDRVFAELQRQYWVLLGRQVVRHHQSNCVECRRWRGQPTVPGSPAALPTSILIDRSGLFWPLPRQDWALSGEVWGLIIKCLTTRCIHLDLLNSLDADAFLLALRRFILGRGTPSEVLPDQGTKFWSAQWELKAAFSAMEPWLQESLATHQITFKFDPSTLVAPGSAKYALWKRPYRWSLKTSTSQC